MSQWKFRLQSLLKLRTAERDRRREELAEAYRADQLLQQRQGAIEEEITGTRLVTREKSEVGTIEVDGLLNTHRYELLLQAELRQIQQRRTLVGAEIDKRRLALVEADRELRILEKLKEKHLAEFEFQELKLETKRLDEVALRRVRTVQKDKLW